MKAFLETKYKKEVEENVLQNVLIKAVNDENIKNNGITFIDIDGSEIKETYRELFENSMKILGKLQSLNIDKGEYVVFQIYNQKKFIEVFWACILGGIIPIIYQLPAEMGRNRDNADRVERIYSEIKKL